jgi:hypothetical protein
VKGDSSTWEEVTQNAEHCKVEAAWCRDCACWNCGRHGWALGVLYSQPTPAKPYIGWLCTSCLAQIALQVGARAHGLEIQTVIVSVEEEDIPF